MARARVSSRGSGIHGSDLVHALRDRGDRVRVFDDLFTGRPVNLDDVASDVELVHGDVRDADAVAAPSTAPTSCSTRPRSRSVPQRRRSRASNDVNVAGTLNVFVAARDAGGGARRLRSSAAVYGNADSSLAPSRGVAHAARVAVRRVEARGGALPRGVHADVRCRPSRFATSTCSARRQNPDSGTRRRSRGSSRARWPARRRRSSATASRRATSCSSTTWCGRTCGGRAPGAGVGGRAFNIGRGERRTVNDARSGRSGFAGARRACTPARARAAAPGRGSRSWSAIAAAGDARYARRSRSRRACGARSTGSRGNEPRTCGNVGPIADARVSELADDSDLKSLALRSVWVRIPPRAPGSFPLAPPRSPHHLAHPSVCGRREPAERRGTSPQDSSRSGR